MFIFRSNFLGHQLQSINPFRIQLSNLLVGNALERDIKYKHALAALNATCIALCTAPSEAVDQYKVSGTRHRIVIIIQKGGSVAVKLL